MAKKNRLNVANQVNLTQLAQEYARIAAWREIVTAHLADVGFVIGGHIDYLYTHCVYLFEPYGDYRVDLTVFSLVYYNDKENLDYFPILAALVYNEDDVLVWSMVVSDLPNELVKSEYIGQLPDSRNVHIDLVDGKPTPIFTFKTTNGRVWRVDKFGLQNIA